MRNHESPLAASLRSAATKLRFDSSGSIDRHALHSSPCPPVFPVVAFGCQRKNHGEHGRTRADTGGHGENSSVRFSRAMFPPMSRQLNSTRHAKKPNVRIREIRGESSGLVSLSVTSEQSAKKFDRVKTCSVQSANSLTRHLPA